MKSELELMLEALPRVSKNSEMLIKFYDQLPKSMQQRFNSHAPKIDPRCDSFTRVLAETAAQAKFLSAKLKPDTKLDQTLTDEYEAVKKLQVNCRTILVGVVENLMPLFDRKQDDMEVVQTYLQDFEKKFFNLINTQYSRGDSFFTEMQKLLDEYMQLMQMIDFEQQTQSHTPASLPREQPLWSADHPLVRGKTCGYEFPQLQNCVRALYANFMGEYADDKNAQVRRLVAPTLCQRTKKLKELYLDKQDQTGFMQAINELGYAAVKEIVFAVECKPQPKMSLTTVNAAAEPADPSQQQRVRFT